MTIAIPKLILTAALAVSVPTVGSAHDDRRPPVNPYPAPATYPAPAPAPGWSREARRHEGWRARERARLRREYARLDQARADFYARPGVRRGQARKFERWYAAQRAELDREWSALSWYAAR